MDLETLYNMAKAAARGANEALQRPPSASHPLYGYGGYAAYISEYNRLVPLVIQLCGKEAEQLFQPVDLGKQRNPADAPAIMWQTYLELASARLNSMASYLQSRVLPADQRLQSINDLVNANLRPAIFKPPTQEREVQNALEVIFNVRAFEFQREKVSIQYSSKTFVPDFTFDSLDLAVEAKLCKNKSKEKTLIDEINADILAYQTRYRHALFVIYDLGFIRDVQLFRSGIEGNQDVHVLVVKH